MMQYPGKLGWTILLGFACLTTPVAAQQGTFQILLNPASFGTNTQALGVSLKQQHVRCYASGERHRSCRLDQHYVHNYNSKGFKLYERDDHGHEWRRH